MEMEMDAFERNLMDNLKMAKISANAQMERLCNNRQYIDGCIYQSIRDNIETQIRLFKSYLYCRENKD